MMLDSSQSKSIYNNYLTIYNTIPYHIYLHWFSVYMFLCIYMPIVIKDPFTLNIFSLSLFVVAI